MPNAPGLIAMTRAVPRSLERCELSHLARQPIDPARAAEQHRRYEETLAELGCTVERLPAMPDHPDSVFVEDTAVVLPDIAVITRPGAVSRRAETESVAEALESHLPLAFIRPPGTLDGGDVLCMDQCIHVGASRRTNPEGIRQFRDLVSPRSYQVRVIAVSACLHLKTAVTAVADGTVLLNPAWVEPAAFKGLEIIEVHPDEPFAANALRVGDAVIHPAACPLTRRQLEQQGIDVRTVESDELAKAEAGLTCCSILIAAQPGAGT